MFDLDYLFSLVTFPGFAFPTSIFEKNRCLYADNRESTDFIESVKRSCTQVATEDHTSSLVLRRSRPGPSRFKEEHTQREDGVELVTLRKAQSEHPSSTKQTSPHSVSDALPALKKESSLPVLNISGVFETDPLNHPPPPTFTIETSPNETVIETEVVKESTPTQLFTSQDTETIHDTISTNQQTPKSFKKSMSEVHVIDYVFCVRLFINIVRGRVTSIISMSNFVLLLISILSIMISIKWFVLPLSVNPLKKKSLTNFFLLILFSMYSIVLHISSNPTQILIISTFTTMSAKSC